MLEKIRHGRQDLGGFGEVLQACAGTVARAAMRNAIARAREPRKRGPSRDSLPPGQPRGRCVRVRCRRRPRRRAIERSRDSCIRAMSTCVRSPRSPAALRRFVFGQAQRTARHRHEVFDQRVAGSSPSRLERAQHLGRVGDRPRVPTRASTSTAAASDMFNPGVPHARRLNAARASASASTNCTARATRYVTGSPPDRQNSARLPIARALSMPRSSRANASATSPETPSADAAMSTERPTVVFGNRAGSATLSQPDDLGCRPVAR